MNFVARSKRGEFALLILSLDNRSLWFDALRQVRTEKLAGIEAELKLILSAIVRDFYVVENRERLFSVRREKRLPIRPRQDRGRITVYLPRVRYTSPPDIERCREELGYKEMRPHSVTAHIRKSPSMSDNQKVWLQFTGLMCQRVTPLCVPTRGVERRVKSSTAAVRRFSAFIKRET